MRKRERNFFFFAEGGFCFMNNFISKKIVHKLTYSYIKNIQKIVSAINLRINRFLNLAPINVPRKIFPRLVSVEAEQSFKLVQRPKLYVCDYVRLVKVDILFARSTSKHLPIKCLKFLTCQHKILQDQNCLILSNNQLRESYKSKH